jgi:hypothetical protein
MAEALARSRLDRPFARWCFPSLSVLIGQIVQFSAHRADCAIALGPPCGMSP